MVSKLATFREDSDIWDSFQAKAKSKGTNASALLQRFVRDYLDSRIDSPAAAPDVDIESIVNEAVESANNELDSRLNKIDEHFATLFVDLSDRLASLENTRSEATAPANFQAALLQRVKEVAPLKMKEVA